MFNSGDVTDTTPAPVMAKRLSLESRISSIKQRLLSSAPTSDSSILSDKSECLVVNSTRILFVEILSN